MLSLSDSIVAQTFLSLFSACILVTFFKEWKRRYSYDLPLSYGHSLVSFFSRYSPLFLSTYSLDLYTGHPFFTVAFLYSLQHTTIALLIGQNILPAQVDSHEQLIHCIKNDSSQKIKALLTQTLSPVLPAHKRWQAYMTFVNMRLNGDLYRIEKYHLRSQKKQGLSQLPEDNHLYSDQIEFFILKPLCTPTAVKKYIFRCLGNCCSFYSQFEEIAKLDPHAIVIIPHYRGVGQTMGCAQSVQETFVDPLRIVLRYVQYVFPDFKERGSVYGESLGGAVAWALRQEIQKKRLCKQDFWHSFPENWPPLLISRTFSSLPQEVAARLPLPPSLLSRAEAALGLICSCYGFSGLDLRSLPEAENILVFFLQQDPVIKAPFDSQHYPRAQPYIFSGQNSPFPHSAPLSELWSLHPPYRTAAEKARDFFNREARERLTAGHCH